MIDHIDDRVVQSSAVLEMLVVAVDVVAVDVVAAVVAAAAAAAAAAAVVAVAVAAAVVTSSFNNIHILVSLGQGIKCITTNHVYCVFRTTVTTVQQWHIWMYWFIKLLTVLKATAHALPLFPTTQFISWFISPFAFWIWAQPFC